VDIGVPGVEGAEEIGAGGFGWVYRAFQPAFDRTVAVKVLRGRILDRRVLERFRRECKAIGAVSGHPNIVHVYDAGTTAGGHPYIVMEFLAHGSLADRLDREGPLRWTEVGRIGVKLAAALHTAHRAGVLHRDLKPENILVSEYGEPLLADFGIARVEGAKETTGGGVKASLAHAPPEIMAAQRADERADVYSLGSVLHTLLTGIPPFLQADDENVLAVLARLSTDTPPDLRTHGVPGPIAHAIDRAMAKRPEDRPASAVAFGRELQAAQNAAGQVPTELPLPADEVAAAASDLPTRAVAGIDVVAYTPPPQAATPPTPQGEGLEDTADVADTADTADTADAAPPATGPEAPIEEPAAAEVGVPADQPVPVRESDPVRQRHGKLLVAGVLAVVVVLGLAALAVREGVGGNASPVEEGTHYFMYGTMKPGRLRYPSIDQFVASTTSDTVEGELFDTGAGYPAAKFGSDRGQIRGYVLRILPDRESAAAEIIAEQEGNLFRPVILKTKGGRTVTAYEFIGPTDGMARIPDGDWNGDEA